jgi:hypothetical protein
MITAAASGIVQKGLWLLLIDFLYHAMYGAKTTCVQMAENLIISWDRIIRDLT